MISPRLGKITKQGPLATLDDFEYRSNDRFMFNGRQFVMLDNNKRPDVIKASPRLSGRITNGEVEYEEYGAFKDSLGNFRLINGVVESTGVEYGSPSGGYDHVVIGFESQVTTDVIKIWSLDAIATSVVSVGYSDTDSGYADISVSVTSEFDSNIRAYDGEPIPSGMYIYTISLGAEYTAKYWKISSFLYTTATIDTVSILDSSVLVYPYPTNWPSSGSISIEVNPTTLVSTEDVYVLGNYQYYSLSSVFSYVDAGGNNMFVDTVVNPVIFLDNANYAKVSAVNEVLIQDGSKFSCSIRYSAVSYTTAHFYLDGSTIFQVNHTNKSLYYTGSIMSYPTMYVSIPASYTASSGGTVYIYQATLHVTFDTAQSWSGNMFLKYLSKSTTQLQHIQSDITTITSNDRITAGSVIKYQSLLNLSQVLIGGTDKTILKFWETDGDECASKEVQISNVLDAVYDVADDVYYVVGFNETGGNGISISDDFSGSVVNVDRWEYDGNSFILDTVTDKIDFLSVVSGQFYGILKNTMYYESGIAVSGSLHVSSTTLNKDDFVGLTLRDYDSNNFQSGTFVLGKCGDVSPQESIVTVAISGGVTDYSGGNAAIRDLVIYPDSLPEYTHLHSFVYNDDYGWRYNRTALGSSYVPNIADLTMGFSPVCIVSGVSLSLSYNDRVTEGSYLSFYTNKTTQSGIHAEEVDLYVKRATGVSTMYAVSGTVTLSSQSVGGATAEKISPTIFGSSSNPVDVAMGPFVSNTGYVSVVPTLYVKAIDNNGIQKSVSGVTDSNGNVITYFDVIRDSTAKYEDYIGNVFIATNHQTEGSGGSLYIANLPDVYKYNKTTLPITTVEDGTNAVVLLSGSITDTNINNFSYDGYYNGGLSYEVYDDIRDGVFIKTLSSSTLSGTGIESELDISSADVPLVVDPNDMDTLYTVDSDSVYIFNIDDNSVAHCSLYSYDPIMPAGSDNTVIITAIVTNLYGDLLQSKTVYFSVSSGDGSVSPSYTCTTSSGTASTTYTAGVYTGNAVIAATATNDAC